MHARIVATLAIAHTSSSTVSSLNLLVAIEFGQVLLEVALILGSDVARLQPRHPRHVREARESPNGRVLQQVVPAGVVLVHVPVRAIDVARVVKLVIRGWQIRDKILIGLEILLKTSYVVDWRS